MFTPKDLQEVAFGKAMFGGYDMQAVDEFLEPLTQDYVTLYKENSVLKSKLKILVEKLEEYRAQEASMKKALMSAQESADSIIADAQRKASRIVNEAETSVQSKELEQDYVKEQHRVESAREIAQEFISKVEEEVFRQLKALKTLKELTEAAAPVVAPVATPAPAPAPVAPPAPQASVMSRFFEAVPTEEPPMASAASDIDPDLAAVIGSAVQEIAANSF